MSAAEPIDAKFKQRVRFSPIFEAMPRGAASRSQDTLLHGPRGQLLEASIKTRIEDGQDSRDEWRDAETELLNREQGPAVVYRDGSWEWWRDGKLDRAKGPAVFLSEEREDWLDPAGQGWGDAIETRLWFKNGQLHRLDGPAVIESGDDGAVESGEHFYREGELHRTDGPAFVRHYADDPSLELWFQQGELHRVDGPAVFFSDGRAAWLRDGKLDRHDGPALIVPETVRGSFPIDGLDVVEPGSQRWYRDGQWISEPDSPTSA